ncbi:hypothetical protein [Zhongshania sp.]|uniref:hypothetical protein n=1 Tax=Zhongshania sp. TaxID=1971902 RepID=UPI001B40B540|nr:hypothetical protein [Zhongshania sp.]MBQ0794531.1 hypothetical protein [Zhongshania sp.]
MCTRSLPSMAEIGFVYSVVAEYGGGLVCVLSRRSLAQCAWPPLRGGSCDFSLPENNIPAW